MEEQNWDPDDSELDDDDGDDEPDELDDDAVEHLTAPESPHDAV